MMCRLDPLAADEQLGLGQLVLNMLAEGYDGEQLTYRLTVTADAARAALNRYVDRVFSGDVPPAPSRDCQINGYNGWCYVHGCFHLSPCDETEAAE